MSDHEKLVKFAAQWLYRKHPVVITEMSAGNEEPDAIGFTADFATLCECKGSRPDFHSDKSKPFRIFPEKGLGRFRYFMCFDDLLNTEELPDKWGLISVQGKRFFVKKKAEAQDSSNWAEKRLLVSTIRRIGDITPPEVRVRHYEHLMGSRATVSICGEQAEMDFNNE